VGTTRGFFFFLRADPGKRNPTSIGLDLPSFLRARVGRTSYVGRTMSNLLALVRPLLNKRRIEPGSSKPHRTSRGALIKHRTQRRTRYHARTPQLHEHYMRYAFCSLSAPRTLPTCPRPPPPGGQGSGAANAAPAAAVILQPALSN
jgi:hypothetical protein